MVSGGRSEKLSMRRAADAGAGWVSGGAGGSGSGGRAEGRGTAVGRPASGPRVRPLMRRGASAARSEAMRLPRASWISSRSRLFRSVRERKASRADRASVATSDPFPRANSASAGKARVSPICPRARAHSGAVSPPRSNRSTRGSTALGSPAVPRASMARSRTHQSGSSRASMRGSTERSLGTELRISTP